MAGPTMDTGTTGLTRAGHILAHAEDPLGSGALAFFRVYRITSDPD
jgi:hypothetical protein